MKPRSQIADPGLFQAILSLSQPTAFQRAFLRREDQLLLTFFGEGSRQLKLNPASLTKQGAESAGRPFSTWCSSTCRSTRKPRDLKSPAPISNPALFCACQVYSGTDCAIPIFEPPAEKELPFVNSLPTASFVSRGSTAFHVSSKVTDLVTGNGNSLAAKSQERKTEDGFPRGFNRSGLFVHTLV